MKTCRINGFIDFNLDGIFHCCESPPGLPRPKVCSFSGGEFPIEEYKESLAELNRMNNSDHPHPSCAACTYLVDTPDPIPEFSSFSSISINAYRQCNLRCIYCLAPGSELAAPTYNLADTLRGMLQGGMITKDTGVFFAGGEPVLAKHFEEISEWCLDNGLFQIILTNGVIFSNAIAEGLKADKLAIKTSVDAGSREVFHKIKGADCYDKVWGNIGKYCAINSKRVIIKYIIMPENWDEEEFVAFAKKCVHAGVKNVVVIPELNALGKEEHIKTTIDKMVAFYKIVSKHGLSVTPWAQFDDENKAYFKARMPIRFHLHAVAIDITTRLGIKDKIKNSKLYARLRK